jgi:hypothetical protein
LTVYESRISKLLVKEAPISEEEFEQILSKELLQRDANPTTTTTTTAAAAAAAALVESGKEEETVSNVIEIVASIHSKGGDQSKWFIDVEFRRNIAGIHQYLAKIRLGCDPTREIDIFEWGAVAVDRNKLLSQRIDDVLGQLAEREKTISRLKNQLEEFQEVHKKDLDVMLDKFCEVLNMKKAKIRDQQRLLAVSKIDKVKGKVCSSVRFFEY